MVWLAAGGSTAILGYILYRYLIAPASSPCPKAETEEDNLDGHHVQDGAPCFTFDGPSPELEDPISFKEVDKLEVPSRNGKSSNGSLETRAQLATASNSVPKTIAMAPPSMKSQTPPRLKPTTFSRIPAPPGPGGSALRPPPSAAASLRVPTQKVLSNRSMAPTSSIMPQTGKPSRKVILQPGHSPLDWAMLTKNPNSKLRGRDVPDHLIRVTPLQLNYYNGRKGRDVWSVYQGKVYNITPYLPFHPGGEGELMRGAAKDAGQLFMEAHPWVNWDNMLFECMVGILVGEDEGKDDKSGALDEID